MCTTCRFIPCVPYLISLPHTHIPPPIPPQSLRTPEATQAAQGWSLPQLIRAGIELPGSPVGLALGSAASYEAYKHLLAPLLREYHAFRAAGPDRDAHVGDLNLAEALAPGAAGLLPRMYVRKITFSACRNLSTFPFPPSQSRKQRRMVEFLLFNAFKVLPHAHSRTHTITRTHTLTRLHCTQSRATCLNIYTNGRTESLFAPFRPTLTALSPPHTPIRPSPLQCTPAPTYSP